MTPGIYWLTLTVLMTALFWIPYILNRAAVRGLMGAMDNPQGGAPHAPWAERAMAAHTNAVENLVVFAPLVLAAEMTGTANATTATAAAVFFFARLAHYLIYMAGIAVARTLAFTVGWLAILVIAFTVLGWM